MKLPIINKNWVFIGLLLVVLLGLTVFWPKAKVRVESPELVAKKFYTWWHKYPGDPLAEKAHHKTKYLTANLVKRVDEVISQPKYKGPDPLTFMHTTPNRIDGTLAQINGDKALLFIEQTLDPNPLPYRIKVELVFVDGKWKIDRVNRAD